MLKGALGGRAKVTISQDITGNEDYGGGAMAQLLHMPRSMLRKWG